jgi:glutathione S-transferase
MALRLYFAMGSCSLASLIALEEAGVPFEAEAIMLSAGEQKRPGYLSINPRGRVPTLLVDEQPITETIAILSYLANRFSAAELLPLDNPYLLGRAYELMSWYATSLHVAIAQIWRTERFCGPNEPCRTAIREHGRAAIEKGFEEIESILAGPWILGDRYSVVDGYTQVFWRWGERLGADMPRFRRWAAHSARLLARAPVMRALAKEKHLTELRTSA